MFEPKDKKYKTVEKYKIEKQKQQQQREEKKRLGKNINK